MRRICGAAGAAAVWVFVLAAVGCAHSTPTQPLKPASVQKFSSTERIPVGTPEQSVIPVVSLSKPDELRVMSFNVRVKIFIDVINNWDSRKELLINTVRDFDPDILGTQECLASQTEYLRQQLPDYGFVGVGRADGKRSGEFVGIYYKSSRFEQVDSGHFWLSRRPDEAGSRGWDAWFPRMVTWVKLRPQDSDQVFCVFNTHFDVFGPRARLESAKLLREKMLEIAPNLPTIITGDFNDSETSRPYNTLMARSDGIDLADAYRTVHPAKAKGQEGTIHDFSGTKRRTRIDWIVATPNFVPIEASIVHNNNRGKYPSDHFPVTAVFKTVPSHSAIASVE